jgi:hypothetical protein
MDSPFAHQCGLAGASRGGDERQFAMETGVQPLDQPRAGHQTWPDGWDIKFGGQERNVLSIVKGWRGHRGVILPRFSWILN